jgi:hypothetical protein
LKKYTQLHNGEGNQLTSQNLKGDASSLEALKESKITDAKNLNSNFTDRGRFLRPLPIESMAQS